MRRTAPIAPLLVSLAACSTPAPPPPPSGFAAPREPPAILGQLSVRHRWDPDTGLIVAEEVVPLPPILADAPPFAEALARSRETGVPLAVFTTADRCGVCQQFKRSTLGDPRLVSFLAEGRVLAVHVEVDRAGDEVREVLGSPAIPATYLLVPGRPPARLAGLRPADAVIAFLSTDGATAQPPASAPNARNAPTPITTSVPK